MIKKILFCIVLLTGCAAAQEVKRPTAEADSQPGTVGWTDDVSGALPNAYDASGLSTSSAQTTNGSSCIPSDCSGGDGASHETGRKFLTWQSASGVYTALILKANWSASSSGQGGSVIFQCSNNSGSTWQTCSNISSDIFSCNIGSSSSMAQTTQSCPLPVDALPTLQIRVIVKGAGQVNAGTRW
jgi:hypothetical protein